MEISSEDKKAINELIYENIVEERILRGKRKRKQTKFYHQEEFVSGKKDQYDRGYGIERNNWWGRSGENTTEAGKEEEEYIQYKCKEREEDEWTSEEEFVFE